MVTLSRRASNIIIKNQLSIEMMVTSDLRKVRNMGSETAQEIQDWLFELYIDGKMTPKEATLYLTPR